MDSLARWTPERVYAAPWITTGRPSACDRAPFKGLEEATRSRLNYRALTDALNTLVNDGAVRRVTEKPARLAITEVGRKHLNEYRS
jgi:hypothetical protein